MCNINYKAVVFDFYHDDEVNRGLMDAIRRIDPNVKCISISQKCDLLVELDNYFREANNANPDQRYIVHFLGHGTKSGIKIMNCSQVDGSNKKMEVSDKAELIEKLKSYLIELKDVPDKIHTICFVKETSKYKVEISNFSNSEQIGEKVTWEEISRHIPANRSNFIFNFTCCYSAYGIKMAQFLQNSDFHIVGLNGRVDPKLSIKFQDSFYEELRKRNNVAEAVKAANIIVLKKFIDEPCDKEYYDGILGVYFHSNDYGENIDADLEELKKLGVLKK